MDRPIKVITFDLDDTLWSVDPVIRAAELSVYRWLQQHCPRLTQRFSQQQLHEHKISVYRRRPDLAHQISQLRREAIREALLAVDYDQGFAEQQSHAAFEQFLHARHQVALFDGVEPLLNTLRHRYRLGVLTNGNANISRLAIGAYFDFAISAEQLNASKPAPDHFHAAMKESGVQAHQIVHIGDHREHDVLAALEAGCHAIWFNPDQLPWHASRQAPPQARQLGQIPSLVEQIERQLLDRQA